MSLVQLSGACRNEHRHPRPQRDAVGGAARIQGNTLIGNAVGVRVEGTGSLIVRNTASNSIAQAFDIAPGNAHGPIINVAGAGDLGALAGADHPLANLVY